MLQPGDPVALDKDAELHIIPFGGCGEFGMNLTAYLSKGDLYVVDCGVMFPDQTKLGIDAIIPDLEPWFEKFGAPKAYIITHGHEDHIGALPLVYPKWPAPIYATKWTVELIKLKFSRYGAQKPDLRTVTAGDTVSLGAFSATYLAVNHSIPMTCSLLIKVGNRRVFHTGDFKIDEKSTFEPPIDLDDFATRCAPGVDALVIDSTNAVSPGESPSEDSVAAPLQKLCESISGTIFLTTFASNLWRLLTVLRIAKALDRKLLVLGAGMRKTIELARSLNMLGESSPPFLDETEARHTPRHKIFVLLSGCQGEPRSALGRLCRDEINFLKLTAGDGVIFSSRIIPGAERSVYHLSAVCAQKGVSVYTSRSHPGIHVSGHAYQEDIRKLITAVKPKYFIPVHGTFTQLMANHDVAVGAGLSHEQCLVPDDGCVLTFDQTGKLKQPFSFEVEWTYVDGMSKQLLSRQTLKERLKIGELGLAVISGVFDYTRAEWQQAPTIELRGIDSPPTQYWQSEAEEAVREAIAGGIRRGIVEQTAIAECARLALRRYLQAHFRKKVVVVAHIHPV